MTRGWSSTSGVRSKDTKLCPSGVAFSEWTLLCLVIGNVDGRKIRLVHKASLGILRQLCSCPHWVSLNFATIVHMSTLGFVEFCDNCDHVHIGFFLNFATIVLMSKLGFVEFCDNCDHVHIGFLGILRHLCSCPKLGSCPIRQSVTSYVILINHGLSNEPLTEENFLNFKSPKSFTDYYTWICQHQDSADITRPHKHTRKSSLCTDTSRQLK